MSGSQFFNVMICSSLCFFQKRGLEITVFLFFDFAFLGNFVLTTLFLFEILVIASLGGAARRT